MTTKLESLLAQRAAILAQPLIAAGEGSGQELICFMSGSLLLGMSKGGLRTVVHAPRMVCIAGLPRGIVGISTFKGELTAVLDFGLWSRLGSPSNGRLLVVLQHNGHSLGLRVDELVDMATPADRPEDTGGASAQPEHCILRVTQGLVSILDLPALFAAMAVSESGRFVP